MLGKFDQCRASAPVVDRGTADHCTEQSCKGGCIADRTAHMDTSVNNLLPTRCPDIDEQRGDQIDLVLLIGARRVVGLVAYHCRYILPIDRSHRDLRRGQHLLRDPPEAVYLYQSARLDLPDDEPELVKMANIMMEGEEGSVPGNVLITLPALSISTWSVKVSRYPFIL